jgi:syntaxin 18
VLVIVESLHELSEMQNTLCRHIYEQTEQLEHVDQNTVEATESIIEGNKQLAEAVESGLDFRIWILIYLMGCSFSLLFLDWYG